MSNETVRSYVVVVSTAAIRPDTKIDGVAKVDYDADLLTLSAPDGRLLYMAPMNQVVSIKEVGTDTRLPARPAM